MACLMLHSPGSRLSLGCTLLLLKTPLLELVQVASRKLTGLGAVTVVTCLTLKYRSLENMPSAKLPVLQLLTALPPKKFAFLCLKSPLHLHQRLQLLLVKYKVHSFFIVLMRNGSTSLVAFKLNFACCNKMNKGSSCMPLTQPKQTHPIGGDGNCMFRSVSYVMTGSQEHHLEVRAKTLEHMETIAL